MQREKETVSQQSWSKKMTNFPYLSMGACSMTSPAALVLLYLHLSVKTHHWAWTELPYGGPVVINSRIIKARRQQTKGNRKTLNIKGGADKQCRSVIRDKSCTCWNAPEPGRWRPLIGSQAEGGEISETGWQGDRMGGEWRGASWVCMGGAQSHLWVILGSWVRSDRNLCRLRFL